MKNFRRSENTWITPTEVMEYLYCPRFIYFMNNLLIPQNEEQRYKVMIGRNVHKLKSKINKEYLRKTIGVKDKLIDVYLSSQKYGIRGIVDEILTLNDNTMAPLDYKFAKYENKIFNTLKYQSVLYAILIEENFNLPVNRGFICYIRSNNRLVEVDITEQDKVKVLNIIEEMFKIIELGYFPKRTKYKNKCIDCCYRNICIK